MGSRYSLLSGRRERAAIAFVAVVALAGALVPAAASANVASPAPSADAATPAPQEGETAAPAEDTPEPEPAADATPDPTPSATPSTAPSPEATDAPAPEPTEDSAVPLAGADYEGDSTPDEADPAGNGAGPDHGQMKTRSLVGFRPGNIITDEVMYSSGSMSTAEIQSFLNLKVPTCRSGYVCLKDFRQTTSTRAATSWCPGTYQGASNESAAQIISKVSRACGVSEKVLLVMLQKEQGLVTHTWPSDWRYTIAMGYACPDNADCDTAFYGFSYQVYMAASQLKRYTLDSWFNWFPVGRTSNVLWHPNASCGSAPVLIENAATAALYYYTPYQPNQASLAAGYGEGDACSSYGNRNFYNYYTDWFGSTQTGGGNGLQPAITSLNATAHLFAVDDAGVLWAYPGNGSGGWANRIQIGRGWASFRDVLGVGDLNGNGNRDLIGVDSAGTAWLYPGDGGLGFGARTRLPVDWSSATMITFAGDFDGDGRPDVFTRNAAGDLLLWRGTVSGGFREPVIVGQRWNRMDVVVGAGDMTGDGNVDAIARRDDGKLFLYRGDGKGGWVSTEQIGHGWNLIEGIYAPGDFTGDGRVDLLGMKGSAIYLYAGRGDGTVTTNGQIGRGWSGMLHVSDAGSVATGKTHPIPAGLGDLDDDGNADVIAVGRSGELRLYPGNGNGGWGADRTIDPEWGTESKTITLGDFTGNGMPDLARIESGRFMLYAGRPDGSFEAGVQIGRGWSTTGLYVGGIDFDNDRNVDVVARTSDNSLYLYRGDGAGGWLDGGAPTLIGTNWGSMSDIIYVGDFDGDGLGDLIARRTDGTLWLYSSNGAGKWRSSSQIGKRWGGLRVLFSPGDFDGDGNPDVAAVNASNQLVLYRGNGEGGWGDTRVIGKNWGSMSWIG